MTTLAGPITVALSQRQHEILVLKLRGYSATAIAVRLGISPTTVAVTASAAYERIREAGALRDVGGGQFLQQLTVAVMAGRVQLRVLPRRILFPC